MIISVTWLGTNSNFSKKLMKSAGTLNQRKFLSRCVFVKTHLVIAMKLWKLSNSYCLVPFATVEYCKYAIMQHHAIFILPFFFCLLSCNSLYLFIRFHYSPRLHHIGKWLFAISNLLLRFELTMVV